MGDCGCKNPKYSAGWCYGMWRGCGCYTRGILWDLDKNGNPYDIPEPDLGAKIQIFWWLVATRNRGIPHIYEGLPEEQKATFNEQIKSMASSIISECDLEIDKISGNISSTFSYAKQKAGVFEKESQGYFEYSSKMADRFWYLLETWRLCAEISGNTNHDFNYNRAVARLESIKAEAKQLVAQHYLPAIGIAGAY